MNIDKSKERIKLPSENAQHRWYDLLSPIRLWIGRQQQQQQQQNLDMAIQEPKKKSRGNRQEQRKRRQLRRQNQRMINHQNLIDQEGIFIDHINDYFNDNEKRQESPLHNIPHYSTFENQCLHQEINQNDVHVDHLLSKLSISPEQKSKIKDFMKTDIDHPSENIKPMIIIDDKNDRQEKEMEEEEEEENDRLLPSNSLQKFVPHYLKVSDEIFKQMLSNTIKDADKIVQCLDTNEKLQVVRQLAEISNNYYYFDTRKYLWRAFFNLGIEENVWTSSNSSTSNIDYIPKYHIEQRQETIAYQLQRTTNDLHQYYIYLYHIIQQWQPSIDLILLIETVNECVKQGQQHLRQEFQYKLDLKQLDLYDSRAITYFYDLKPNDEQILLTKRYWQIVTNQLRITEEIEKLRQQIHLQQVPNKINKMLNPLMNHIQSMLTNSVLDQDRRVELTSSYSKMMSQFEFDLLSLNLSTMHNIRRGHQQLLLELQEKILLVCYPSLKQVIENRRQIMEKRHQICLAHTLQNNIR